ncbi:hypothetical protein N9J24_02475 [Bacteroidia bacterium]|nr:hypothetical protein [Bacteroidia bacterium]
MALKSQTAEIQDLIKVSDSGSLLDQYRNIACTKCDKLYFFYENIGGEVSHRILSVHIDSKRVDTLIDVNIDQKPYDMIINPSETKVLLVFGDYCMLIDLHKDNSFKIFELNMKTANQGFFINDSTFMVASVIENNNQEKCELTIAQYHVSKGFLFQNKTAIINFNQLLLKFNPYDVKQLAYANNKLVYADFLSGQYTVFDLPLSLGSKRTKYLYKTNAKNLKISQNMCKSYEKDPTYSMMGDIALFMDSLILKITYIKALNDSTLLFMLPNKPLDVFDSFCIKSMVLNGQNELKNMVCLPLKTPKVYTKHTFSILSLFNHGIIAQKSGLYFLERFKREPLFNTKTKALIPYYGDKQAAIRNLKIYLTGLGIKEY